MPTRCRSAAAPQAAALGAGRVARGLIALVAVAGAISAAPSPSPPPLVYGGDASFPPFEYLDERGKPRGFNVELVRVLAARAGRDVEVRLVPWAQLTVQLERGEVDVVSVARSRSREARYDFIEQTWTLQETLLFLPGRSGVPRSLDDLGGETVAALPRSVSWEMLEALPAERRPLVLAAADHLSALRMLGTGQATAVAGNALCFRYAATGLGMEDLVEAPLGAFSYELATAKGRGASYRWLGDAVLAVRRSGERNRLVERFLVLPPRPWQARDAVVPLLTAATALVALFGGVMAWNRSLRRQVQARTQELSALGERQRALIDAVPDLVFRLSSDGRFLDVHGSVQELFIPPEEFLGRAADELPLPPALTEPLRLAAARAMETGTVQRFEYDLPIGGEPRTYEARLARITGTTELVVLARNVSAERAAQRALVESESRYRALFESMPEAVWVYALDDFQVLDVNPAAEAQYGYARADFLMMRLPDVLPAEGMAVLREAAASGLPTVVHGGVWRHPRRDGSWIEVEVASHAMSVGGRAARCEIVRDVTERERTRRFKEELLSVAAHELRNPLTAIVGTLSYVGRSAAPEDRQLLAMASRNAQRMNRLIGDLLEVEKIQSEGFQYHIAPHPVPELLRDAVASNEGAARARHVTLCVEEPVPDAVVAVDADRTLQVLTNLLANAIRYSPPGGTVSLGASIDGTRVRLSVRDRGPGIPPAFQARVFQRFARAKDQPSNTGSGLGLAIARALVEGMHGTIGFETAPGEGTTFHVELPVVATPLRTDPIR